MKIMNTINQFNNPVSTNFKAKLPVSKEAEELFKLLTENGYTLFDILNMSAYEVKAALEKILKEAEAEIRAFNTLKANIEKNLTICREIKPPTITFDQAVAYMNLKKDISSFENMYNVKIGQI